MISPLDLKPKRPSKNVISPPDLKPKRPSKNAISPPDLKPKRPSKNAISPLDLKPKRPSKNVISPFDLEPHRPSRVTTTLKSPRPAVVATDGSNAVTVMHVAVAPQMLVVAARWDRARLCPLAPV